MGSLKLAGPVPMTQPERRAALILTAQADWADEPPPRLFTHLSNGISTVLPKGSSGKGMKEPLSKAKYYEDQECLVWDLYQVTGSEVMSFWKFPPPHFLFLTQSINKPLNQSVLGQRHAQGVMEVRGSPPVTFSRPTTLRGWDFILWTSTVPNIQCVSPQVFVSLSFSILLALRSFDFSWSNKYIFTKQHNVSTNEEIERYTEKTEGKIKLFYLTLKINLISSDFITIIVINFSAFHKSLLLFTSRAHGRMTFPCSL